MIRATIKAIASYLPTKRVTNEELARRHGSWSAEQIFQKVGIHTRHVAADNECASDLAVKAAEKLFETKLVERNDIDYILYCTQSPDYFLPTTACVIQRRLGIPKSCGALDFNLGCSGYIYGLSIAKGLIATQQARCILLLTADTYSKFINPRDFSVCSLFGDAGAATIVRAEKNTERGIGDFVFGTDGTGYDQLIVPTGGARHPRTNDSAVETRDQDGNFRSRENLFMNGREIFRFAIQVVPPTISSLLKKTGGTLAEIDHLVLHQANRFLLDELTRKIQIPRAKTPYEFEDVGNTVSSTIPLALERMARKGALQPGHKLMLIGFGVGYSWGGCTLVW
jgi:3-oxoacyl-[acyl-carrier-protein] synthase-3